VCKPTNEVKVSVTTEYDKIFQTQLQTGIIEPVPQSKWNSSGVHFLPHHGVVRENKDTTKLRIVFNGSAKAKTQYHSINDCLEKGPNLTPLIFDVLLRFRTHRVGVIADIENAFQQVMIEEGGRNILRLLWFNGVHREQSLRLYNTDSADWCLDSHLVQLFYKELSNITFLDRGTVMQQ